MSGEYETKRLLVGNGVKWFVYIGLAVLSSCIIIPSFMSSSERTATKSCQNQLRQIQVAKGKLILKQGGMAWGSDCDNPKTKELIQSFIKGNPPNCPDGGIYTYSPIGIEPTCSLGPAEGRSDHCIPFKHAESKPHLELLSVRHAPNDQLEFRLQVTCKGDGPVSLDLNNISEASIDSQDAEISNHVNVFARINKKSYENESILVIHPGETNVLLMVSDYIGGPSDDHWPENWEKLWNERKPGKFRISLDYVNPNFRTADYMWTFPYRIPSNDDMLYSNRLEVELKDKAGALALFKMKAPAP